MKTKLLLGITVIGVSLAAGGCFEKGGAPDHTEDDAAQHEAPAVSDRIDIPPSVRQNLGITFIKVEARRVEQTLRVPGRFEYLPTAKREYRTMLPGRVELFVEQYETVEAGRPLYRIESPGWRSIQQQLNDSEAAIERSTTRLASFGPLRAAHRNHEKQLESSIRIRRERVAQLESVSAAGGGRMAELIEARGAVSTAEADLAEVLEKEAELEADESEVRSELSAATSKRDFLLDSAALILRSSVDELSEDVEGPHGPQPRWRAINSIVVKAEEAGVVESLGLTQGAWADEKTTVLIVVQTDRLRFRGVGLQSDLGWLRDGLFARVVAPSPTRAAGAIDLADSMEGTLTIGLTADPDDRTVDVFVVPEQLASWVRAGVSAQLEIVTDGSAATALAIPKTAVQRDGLVPVIFRRDPRDVNKAIRMEADLGLDDGRWIVSLSGLQEGDEVVLDGAFQLMLATASDGSQSQGGHFHADGTFHAEDD